MVQVGAGDLVAGLARPAHAGADRALARPPAEHQQRGAPGSESTVSGGISAAIPSTLAARSSVIRSWLAPS